MTPIDAAKRLAGDYPGHCPVTDCKAWLQANGEHMRDCPWLALPKIVAALEAANRMVDEVGEPVQPPEDFGVTEIPDRLYRPLIAALRGEEVKA